MDVVLQSANPAEMTSTILASLSSSEVSLEDQKILLNELSQKVEEQKRQLELQEIRSGIKQLQNKIYDHQPPLPPEAAPEAPPLPPATTSNSLTPVIPPLAPPPCLVSGMPSLVSGTNVLSSCPQTVLPQVVASKPEMMPATSYSPTVSQNIVNDTANLIASMTGLSASRQFMSSQYYASPSSRISENSNVPVTSGGSWPASSTWPVRSEYSGEPPPPGTEDDAQLLSTSHSPTVAAEDPSVTSRKLHQGAAGHLLQRMREDHTSEEQNQVFHGDRDWRNLDTDYR